MVSANDVASPVAERVLKRSDAKAARQKRPIRKILRPRVALRLLGICFFGCLTGFLIFDTPYWMAGIWTALATAGLFYETVRFMDQSERKLTSFLQALNQNDFSVTFYENNKSDDYDFHKAFNDLNETFKSLRSDKESQHQLLKVIVETAAVPMICFEDGSGDVYLMNESAKKLFHIPFLQNTQALWRVDAGLPRFMQDIHDGEKESLKLVLQGKAVFLSVTSQHIIFRDSNLKLIAFHDVSSELAAHEAETWQKLLRVLTHEISNSAIPLSTLSSYIYDLMSKGEGGMQQLSDDERKDVMVSLKTIDQRSRSLKEFVQNFKSVNQVPEPVLERIKVMDLLNEIHSLFQREFQGQDIQLAIPEPAEFYEILADRDLTMQVLINLIKNAIESMSNFREGKTIGITLEKMGRYLNVHVADTGCGIDPEDLEQIFIPFYSTKKSGSGIGLSISQQIMQKQRGDISVRSKPGKGSVFTLTFSQ